VTVKRTSHGLPKLLDCIDCSGAGDIDTSTVRMAETAGDGTSTLIGLTGRKLKVCWNGADGSSLLA